LNGIPRDWGGRGSPRRFSTLAKGLKKTCGDPTKKHLLKGGEHSTRARTVLLFRDLSKNIAELRIRFNIKRGYMMATVITVGRSNTSAS